MKKKVIKKKASSETIVSSLQNEYWYNVANQSEIPLAGNTSNKNIDVTLLYKIVSKMPKGDSKAFLTNEIQSTPGAVKLLRTLVGISEKRMYLELNFIFSKIEHPSDSNLNILNHSKYEFNKKPLSFFIKLMASQDKHVQKISRKVIVDYLLKKDLGKVLKALKKNSLVELTTVIDKLVLTKEIQQSEAKRRGHGGEHVLAELLYKLGCKLIPERGQEKQMGFKDPNIDKLTFEIIKKSKKSWSLDLIITDDKNAHKIFIQSLIHTSDPGQFGVNKSNETSEIKQSLDAHNKKNKSQKELWGLVDGVGYSENKENTIDKMLPSFDCFIQMKSIYKAALRLHQLKMVKIKSIQFDKNFYSEADAKELFKKYGSKDIEFIPQDKVVSGGIKAGMAKIFI